MAITRVTQRSIREAVEALHQVRLDQDLSYDQLALAVGVSRRNLFRLMNDRRASVQDRTLHKIAGYLERVAAENAASSGESPLTEEVAR